MSYSKLERLRDNKFETTIIRYMELAKKMDSGFQTHPLIVLLAPCFIGSSFLLFAFITDADIPEQAKHIASIPTAIILIAVCILSFCLMPILEKRFKRNKLDKIDEMTKENPYFDEFYEVWKIYKRQSNREEMIRMKLEASRFSAKLA